MRNREIGGPQLGRERGRQQQPDRTMAASLPPPWSAAAGHYGWTRHNDIYLGRDYGRHAHHGWRRRRRAAARQRHQPDQDQRTEAELDLQVCSTLGWFLSPSSCLSLLLLYAWGCSSLNLKLFWLMFMATNHCRATLGRHYRRRRLHLLLYLSSAERGNEKPSFDRWIKYGSVQPGITCPRGFGRWRELGNGSVDEELVHTVIRGARSLFVREAVLHDPEHLEVASLADEHGGAGARDAVAGEVVTCLQTANNMSWSSSTSSLPQQRFGLRGHS